MQGEIAHRKLYYSVGEFSASLNEKSETDWRELKHTQHNFP